MNILDVSKIDAEYIITDESPYSEYIRYGADSWSKYYGQSLEEEYYCEKLEEEYQIYKKINEPIITPKK